MVLQKIDELSEGCDRDYAHFRIAKFYYEQNNIDDALKIAEGIQN
jgi:hypothetical protein